MKRFTDKKSFVLVFALPMILLIIFVCTTLLVICGTDIFLGRTKCNYMRAYCIADAGIADGYAHLRAGGWTPSLQPFSKNYNIDNVIINAKPLLSANHFILDDSLNIQSFPVRQALFCRLLLEIR